MSACDVMSGVYVPYTKIDETTNCYRPGIIAASEAREERCDAGHRSDNDGDGDD